MPYGKKLRFSFIKSTALKGPTAGWPEPCSTSYLTVSLAARRTRAAAALWRFSQARWTLSTPEALITTDTMGPSQSLPTFLDKSAAAERATTSSPDTVTVVGLVYRISVQR